MTRAVVTAIGARGGLMAEPPVTKWTPDLLLELSNLHAIEALDAAARGDEQAADDLWEISDEIARRAERCAAEWKRARGNR